MVQCLSWGSRILFKSNLKYFWLKLAWSTGKGNVIWTIVAWSMTLVCPWVDLGNRPRPCLMSLGLLWHHTWWYWYVPGLFWITDQGHGQHPLAIVAWSMTNLVHPWVFLLPRPCSISLGPLWHCPLSVLDHRPRQCKKSLGPLGHGPWWHLDVRGLFWITDQGHVGHPLDHWGMVHGDIWMSVVCSGSQTRAMLDIRWTIGAWSMVTFGCPWSVLDHAWSHILALRWSCSMLETMCN